MGEKQDIYMSLRIVTDASADITPDTAARLQIGIVPIPVCSDSEEFFSEADANAADAGQLRDRFYRKLRAGVPFRTKAISPDGYASFLKPYAERGDEVICCCTSSALSQNFTHAKAARRKLLEVYPEFHLTIIDSNEISLGLGIPVMVAAGEALKGTERDRILKRLIFECMHQKLIFVVPDVRYLVPDAQEEAVHHPHFLEFVPVLEVATSGNLSVIERTRNMGNALERLLQLAGQYGTDLSGKTVGIIHADAEPLADHLRSELKKRFHVKGFITECAGAAVAAHAGPDAVGIIFEY